MNRLLLFLAVLIFTSCEKEVSFNFEHEPKLCLNCILNPDSIVIANLTLSKKLDNSDDFAPVENAVVTLYEDDVLWGNLKAVGNGNYKLTQNPINGRKYKIVAETVGYEQVKATTIVPIAPEIIYSKDTTGHSKYNERILYNLNVEMIDKPGNDYYWLFETHIVNSVMYGGGCHAINAPFVDTFNRSIETEAKYGFTHFLQIRISDEGYDGQVLSFIIPDFVERDEYTAQHFLNADEHYDKYIKTTIINKMKEDSELPFYEPIQIYSNIENGYGIFGSCAITTVKL